MSICIGEVANNSAAGAERENQMPIMIGAVSGLMDGLGISLFSKGDWALGTAWFFTGLAVAFSLYMRVRNEQRVAVKSEVKRDDR